MYVNVQSVVPNMFVCGDVPWVSFGFSFSCVNRIICCCTCILQLKYNFYFSIVREGKMTLDETCGCMFGHLNCQLGTEFKKRESEQ
jgi:hypothetical protein